MGTYLTCLELINIFEIFLPQLLRYPNPADPLNGEAAALLMRDPKAYAKKVESYVERFAAPGDADGPGDGDDDDEDRMGGPGSYKPKKRLETNGHAAAGAGAANGSAAGVNGNGNANGNGASSNGNGAAEEDDEDEDDKMSDMGELSDGDDEFMGEMDD